MKFGVREICDVVFKATATQTIGTKTFAAGEPVLYIDTAKTSTLEGAATTVYATGGKGNTRLLAWEGEKTLTFTVEDAMLSPLGFSVLTGAGLVEASEAAPQWVHIVVEGTAKSATDVDLSAEDFGIAVGSGDSVVTYWAATDPVVSVYGTIVDPRDGSIIRSIGAATAKTAANTATATEAGSDITYTFTGAAMTAGDKVLVDTYVRRAADEVKQLTITADKFAGYYYVEASTLFRDQATGVDMPAELILPKIKIQSNFTFAMAATGDPSTFSFVMDAFPGATPFSTEKVLCAIQILGDATYGS